MTEKELRNKPVAWLEKYNGCTRGSAGHKQILATFNAAFNGYTMTVTDPHCAATVSAAFIATKLTDVFPCVECSCNRMISLAKKAGLWEERDSYIATTGDVVLYDWEDSGVGDNTGVADHVGLIVSTSGGYFDVIEGNMAGGKVGHRRLPVNGRYIRGFILPNYKKKATSSANTAPAQQASTSTAGIRVGDKVKVINAVTDDGRRFKTYYDKYDVIEVKGDRVVIGVGKTVTAAVKASNLAKVSSGGAFEVGDKVKVINAVTDDGRRFKTYYDKYDVIEVKGDRVVIGVGKTVTAAVKAENLKKV